MVMQVPDVIAHEVVERRRRVGRHHRPGAFEEIVLRVYTQADVVWHSRHHASEVPVVERPQIDQLVPVGVLIPLRADPAILFIAWKDQIVHPLRAHESLVVI